MRSIPDSMDPDVVRAVDARLDRVEEEHGVSVVWAIESGSRAWALAEDAFRRLVTVPG
jgi:hypothetical protein